MDKYLVFLGIVLTISLSIEFLLPWEPGETHPDTFPDWISQIDHDVLSAVLALRNPVLDLLFPVLSMAGTASFSFILSAYLYFKGDKKYSRRLLLTTIVCALSVWTLKDLIMRPRPFITHAVVPLEVPPSYSFPSGHSAQAFVLVSVLDKKLRKFSVPLAPCIAFSRMYLGVHYLSDILAGSLIGLFIGWIISHRLTTKHRMR